MSGQEENSIAQVKFQFNDESALLPIDAVNLGLN